MTPICAHRTAAVDVKRTFAEHAVGVAVGREADLSCT